MSLVPVEIGRNSNDFSGTTLAITTSVGVTLGQGIAVCAFTPAALSGTTTVVDTAGNTYTFRTTAANAGNCGISWFTADNCSALGAGGTITLTLATGLSHRMVTAYVYDGAFLGTTNPGNNGGFGTGMNTLAMPLTTDANACIIGGFGWMNNATTFTPAGSYTQVSTQNQVDTTYSMAVEYQVMSVTGTYTPSATLGSSQSWAAAGITTHVATPLVVAKPQVLGYYVK